MITNQDGLRIDSTPKSWCVFMSTFMFCRILSPTLSKILTGKIISSNFQLCIFTPNLSTYQHQAKCQTYFSYIFTKYTCQGYNLRSGTQLLVLLLLNLLINAYTSQRFYFSLQLIVTVCRQSMKNIQVLKRISKRTKLKFWLFFSYPRYMINNTHIL